MTSSTTAAISPSTPSFLLLGTTQTLTVDYTPSWKRGNPNSFIDSVTFPKVLTDRKYQYRVVLGSSQDLGTKNAYEVQSDGSQKVNLLEWHAGRGVRDTETIRIFLVDPENGNGVAVARWN